MPEPIRIPGGVIVPAEALKMKAVRASGPGGQNVNKVASKVELRLDLDKIQGLKRDSRERLDLIVATRQNSAGWVIVRSQRFRDQSRNLEDARDKIRAWITLAMRPARQRVATNPSLGGRERRLQSKHRHAETKRNRRLALDD